MPWFNSRYKPGFNLDKDILVPGNKVYTERCCCVVPMYVNNAILRKRCATDQLPTGVSYFKITGKYRAQVRADGTIKQLGYFATPEEARTAYVEAKRAELCRVADYALARGDIDENIFDKLRTFPV